MKIKSSLPLKRALIALLSFTGTAIMRASLTADYQFNGNGNWSLDAVGSNNTPIGNLRADVPTGSTVVKAFLYSSATPDVALGSVTFDGMVLSAASFTNLGSNGAGLTAFRADVTSQVQAKIGSGSGSEFNFAVNNESPNEGLDGEVLAVVYSNPADPVRTIAFLDGFSSSTGDSFKVNLSNPLVDPTTPGFEALMSLGIGFSFQNGGSQQFSNVNVDGRALTHSAGGEDDGVSVDGGLITVGGIGDNPANPVDPNAAPSSPRSDDELYNLALGNSVDPMPFLHTAETSFTVNTDNPSNDDNIFFAGINITASAGVNQPAPPDVPPSLGAVPEPSTYGLLGIAALAGLMIRRQRGKK
jgi:hypothetical protein